MRRVLIRLGTRLLLIASVVPVILLSPSLVRAPVTLIRELAVRSSACAGLTPTHVKLTRLAGPRVRISWKVPSGSGGAGAVNASRGKPSTYRVLRSGHTVGQTKHTSMVVSITPGRRTTFTVEARYGGAPSVCAARLTNRLALRAPGQVRGLRVLASAAHKVTIGWKQASTTDAPIVGYRILRDKAVVGQTRKRAYSLTLSAGRSHLVQVAAVDSRGRIGKASVAIGFDRDGHVISTGASGPPTRAIAPGSPSAPTGLGVSEVGDSAATVLWLPSQPGSAPVVGYRVYRDGRLVTQTTQTSVHLTHLASARTYSITVSAVDSAHREGPPSSAVKLNTSHTAPEGPGLISAVSVTDTSATLSWQAGHASSGTLVGYLLIRDGQPVQVLDAQSVTVALASQRSYSFTVRALDSWGYLSAPAPTITVVTTHTPPSTPSGLNATQVGWQSATVAWSASSAVSGQIVGYRVFRNGIPVGQSSGTEMTLTSLAPSTGYEVTVAAVDSLGAVSAASSPLQLQTAEPPPTHGNVQAFMLASTDQSFDDLQAHYQQIGVVYPTYFECGLGGSIEGNNDPLVTGWAVARKIEVMPRLNCQNPNVEDQILNEPAVQQSVIEGLSALCETYGYQGIQIDFEGAQPSERNPFTAFITALAARLHGEGRKLSTIVTAKYYNIQTGRAAMYDDAALSVPSDYIFVLDWGLHWTTSTPGAMDDLAWSRKVAEYTATMPNKQKFVLGVPLYGIDWPAGGGSSHPGTPMEYGEIMELEARYGITPEWEPVAAAPHFSYTDSGGVAHSVWYTDQQSLEQRLAVAESLGLHVGVWHLGNEDQSVWELPGLGGTG